MAIRAMTSQIAARSRGDPSDFAMAAGVRKMPSAMDSPVTTAIAAARPSCRLEFSGFGSVATAEYYVATNVTGIHRKF